MDKVQMAHDMALAMAADGNVPNDNIVAIVWQYADAMQAEADKRKSSGLPDALKEEWQPDWSQAPDEAKYWAMDKDCSANFFKTKPEITNENGWDFGGVMQSDNRHGFTGNWKDSLRERPE